MAFKMPDAVANISQAISKLSRSKDGKYFQTTRRGEIHELKEDLHSANKDKKKDAVKKVIAAMTVGKDISNLFPDVVNCMQTTNIELKKLVYLYVINYAKTQPELAILAVNTFRKDALDSNPLIRALAVRTMGCIRLEEITEYLVEPLLRACKDTDPYVRKTAAICIAKLYDTSPDTVETQGFFDILQDMLGDANPMVVANAVAALSEISETSGKTWLKLNQSTVGQLLSALNECTEWGQVFLLDALAKYEPGSSREAEDILDRVTARMSHANAAVVMSAIKVVLSLLDSINDPNSIRALQKVLCPPLVTLLSSEPELCYVALRNISLIAQKRPGILTGDIKIFFCKYNDQIYVKMEKLEILVLLANERNVDQVLAELKECASEIDIEFVRKSVQAIGRCAIKLSGAAQRCINILLELIKTRINYIVQQAICVIRDIFRKYPNRYEAIITLLCEHLDCLDEPDAKASMIWIIGEYTDRVDNSLDLLTSFIDNFHDEPASVQMQILTAGVKLFLNNPKSTKTMITRLLKIVTEEVDNPDLRDRGYIYWRLLSSNPEATRTIVLTPKPPITDDLYSIDAATLDELIQNLSMLASVYHKPPSVFIMSMRDKARQSVDIESESESDNPVNAEKIQEEMRNAKYSSGDEDHSSHSSSSSSGSDESESDESSSETTESEEKLSDDLICLGDESSVQTTRSMKQPTIQFVQLLHPTAPGSQGVRGLEIHGCLLRHKGAIQLRLRFTNHLATALTNWDIQVNKNVFGLAIGSSLGIEQLAPGATIDSAVKLNPNENNSNTTPTEPLVLQVAVRTSVDIFYITLPHDIAPYIVDESAVSKSEYRRHWKRLQDLFDNAKPHTSLLPVNSTSTTVQSALKVYNIKLVSMISFDTHDALQFSCYTTSKVLILLEIFIQNPSKGRGIKITYRSDAVALGGLFVSLLSRILTL